MQAAPYPPPMARPEPIKPSAGWYGLAAALAVGGIIIAIVVVIRTVVGYTDRIDDDFQRVDVPGSGTVVLDTGGYSVYHEYFGADERGGGDYFDPEVSVSVTAPDGSDVDLEPYDTSVTYYTTDHEGVALFSFEAEEAGEYTVSVDGSEGQIAVGRGLSRGIVSGVVGAIVVGLIGAIAGAVVAIVIAISRSRERQRRRAAFTQSRSGWPPAPGTGAPPPGTGAPAGGYGGWQGAGQPGAAPSPGPYGGGWQQPPANQGPPSGPSGGGWQQQPPPNQTPPAGPYGGYGR